MLKAVASTDYIRADVARCENDFASSAAWLTASDVALEYLSDHAGLEALGIGDVDEVIAPANTFIASMLPILGLRPGPAQVDCHEFTATLDPNRVESAIVPQTRAIYYRGATPFRCLLSCRRLRSSGWPG